MGKSDTEKTMEALMPLGVYFAEPFSISYDFMSSASRMIGYGNYSNGFGAIVAGVGHFALGLTQFIPSGSGIGARLVWEKRKEPDYREYL